MGADFLWHSLLSYDFCAGRGSSLSYVSLYLLWTYLDFSRPVCRSCFSQKRMIFGALRLKSGNCMLDRSGTALTCRATLVRISYEFPYFSQSFALVRVLWLKNDNCLLAMRIAAAIVECMISIFPPLTPDFPALWLKSLCRPCERHAGRAHTAAIIRYRLPVSSRHPALVSLSS